MDTERSTLSRYYKSGHRHYLCRIQTSWLLQKLVA
jgi:hypothetical protein